jgi:hypothetical protein
VLKVCAKPCFVYRLSIDEYADGPTEAEIRVSLKKDEEEAAAKGMAPLHGTSATAFLTAGLQLEDSQWVV